MKWQHKCSLEWLDARRRYLTATDVKDLLPLTKGGRKKKVTDVDRLKVLARKMATVTEEDCWSYGAMARGHCLEPYAIDLFNEAMAWADDEKLYHWDDMIVSHLVLGQCLAFSPDAMDVRADSKILLKGSVVQRIGLPIVKKIGEVKSYSPERHLVCGYADKMDLEERWQVAVAMAVLTSIDVAYLIFYNPSMKGHEMFVHDYSREDLKEEIEIIKEIEVEWMAFVHDFDNIMPHQSASFSGGKSEIEIYDEILQDNAMMPGGIASTLGEML